MTRTLTIALNLRPGESVVIDAEQYYINYQNGTDATDSASGDWPDALSRATQRIDIGWNRSSVSAEITYTERYL